MKLTEENIARLKQLIRDGSEVLREVDDLKDSLKATVDSVAKELDIKGAIINRLIRDIHSNKVNDKREDWEILDELYKVAGLG